jgi:hypothetical protein
MNGKLVAHKAFGTLLMLIINADARLDCNDYGDDFVSDEVKDGTYLLNLQIASFENDASPSKPVLYAILKDEL